jgi:hypothetical protein
MVMSGISKDADFKIRTPFFSAAGPCSDAANSLFRAEQGIHSNHMITHGKITFFCRIEPEIP